MRTYLLLFTQFFFLSLFSQNTPVLNDSDLLKPDEVGKKAGWLKVRLNVPGSNVSGHEYYKFSSKWGYNTLLDKPGKFKVIYRREARDSSRLNGPVDFYDQSGHWVMRDVYQDGFLIKEWDLYSWGIGTRHKGRLNYVTEFIPGENQVEMILHGFNKRSQFVALGHYSYSKKGLTMLDGDRSIRIDLELVRGWIFEGPGEIYTVNTDTIRESGSKSLTIRSLTGKVEDGARLRQDINAERYRGKRIRMSGYAKTELTAGWAAFQLDVFLPGSAGDQPVAFDDMSERKIQGSTNWTKYELVVDVPVDASVISLRGVLRGKGQVWFDDIQLEVVGPEVPQTGMAKKEVYLPKEPVNLDFEH
jgi:hypothetical protein